VGFGPPTALNWKTEAINPRANLSPNNKKRSLAKVDCFSSSYLFLPLFYSVTKSHYYTNTFRMSRESLSTGIISLTFIPNVFTMAFMKRERKIAVEIIKWWWRSSKREVCPLGYHS